MQEGEGDEQNQKNGSGSKAADKGKCQGDEDITDSKTDSLKQDQYWTKLAERTVQCHVELIAEPESEQKLKEILDMTALREIAGTPGSDYIAILVDQKQSGESITAPHIRCTPFNRKRVMKLLGAVVKSRGIPGIEGENQEVPLKDGDVLMFLDTGKSGVQSRMASLVKQVCGRTCKKQVMVAFSEESVTARKMRVRGVATVDQSEGLTLMTSSQFSVPEKKREHYQGSNRGSVLAWVKLPKWESCWKLTFGDKKTLYGKARVPVGGTSVDVDADEDEEEMEGGEDKAAILPMAVDASGHLYIPKTRNNDNMEPVSFWSMPVAFYKELIGSYCCKGVYDLFAGAHFLQNV